MRALVEPDDDANLVYILPVAELAPRQPRPGASPPDLAPTENFSAAHAHAAAEPSMPRWESWSATPTPSSTSAGNTIVHVSVEATRGLGPLRWLLVERRR
jgi:hypothetical protein